MYSFIKILKKNFLIYENKIIELQNLSLKKDSLIILNNILFLNKKNFKNINLKKIFYISRLVKNYKKKIKIIKFKRRKNYKKIKNFKFIINKVIIKKLNLKLN